MEKAKKLRTKTIVLIICGITLACLALLVIFLVMNNKEKPLILADNLDQIQGLEEYTPSGELAIAFSNEVSYVVKDITWDGDIGIATIKITTPDLSKIISDSIEKAIGENGVDNYDLLLDIIRRDVVATLNSEKHPIAENTIEMDAKKTTDGYILISNDDFEKIISGNLEEIYIQALMEGIENEVAD